MTDAQRVRALIVARPLIAGRDIMRAFGWRGLRGFLQASRALRALEACGLVERCDVLESGLPRSRYRAR